METMQTALQQFKNGLQEVSNLGTQSRECGLRLPDGSNRVIRTVDENTCEVTTYKGEPATDRDMKDAVAMLAISYPQVKTELYGVLCARWKDEGWTAERIKDAISNLIDTCKYPTFSIGQIMSYDRPMKLYTHGGYMWLINNGLAQDADACGDKSDFGKLYIDKGKPTQKVFFYLKKDVEKYRAQAK
ncbi:MAG: hypothetical protein J6T22_09445 [Bacteroidales bacterium]|nr:hypothetical protein [Bacteroidales bacterium]MBO7617418.1 hypothetical protein [Bacteroidales bacterium]